MFNIYGEGVYGGGTGGSSSGPSGSGTLNYIVKWTPNGTTLGDSLLFDNGTNVGLGSVIPAHYFDVVKAQNDVTTVNISNTNAGIGAQTRYRLFNGTSSATFEHFGTGFSSSNSSFANGASITSSGAGGLSIVTSNAAGDLRFYVGSGTTIKARILATNGFLGVNVSPTAMGHFVGSTADNSAFVFKAENSSLVNMMSIRNDGIVTWGTKMIWNNSNLTLSIDGSGSSVDTLSVTSTISHSAVFSQFGSDTTKSSLYARTENAVPVTPLWSVWERAGNSSYISVLKLFNRGTTTIGVGAGAGIDFSASVSTGANPINYAQMGMVTTSITAASYAGYLFWKVSTAASLVEIMRLYTNGLYIGGASAPTAFLHIVAGTTAQAQINLSPGVAPTSPNDGDIYYINTNDRFMVRKNTLDSEIVSASAVTTEVVVSDTTLTITYNGTTYKLLARA